MKPRIFRIFFLLSFFLAPCFGAFSQDHIIPPPIDTPTPEPPPAETPQANPAGSQDHQPVPADGQASGKTAAAPLPVRPWLNDLFSWNETFDVGHQQVQPNETGAYCVGNGHAFALVGLTNPLWTLSNIYGATYQEPDLGGLRMSVTR